MLSLGLAGLVAPTQLRNLASGLSLATRSRLREGDLVTIGALEGTVRDIGLLRVGLRTVDGGLTHVPAADFDRVAVTVGSRRAAVPIEARVVAGTRFDERGLERLRQRLEAWLAARLPEGDSPRIPELSSPTGSGMSSETLLFDAHWVEGGEQRSGEFVARVEPDPGDVPLFPTYDLEAQFEVMRRVAEQSAVAVPRVR